MFTHAGKREVALSMRREAQKPELYQSKRLCDFSSAQKHGSKGLSFISMKTGQKLELFPLLAVKNSLIFPSPAVR
jgi:hypothetical protein